MRQRVTLLDQRTGRWFEFTDPVSILSAHAIDDVIPTLRDVEARVERDNVWAAGFVSYDAAPAFDSALRSQSGSAMPLVWFGLFAEPAIASVPPPIAPATSIAWTPTVTRDEYDAAIAAIKAHIADGDTYQVNYTFRLNAKVGVSGWDLFRAGPRTGGRLPGLHRHRRTHDLVCLTRTVLCVEWPHAHQPPDERHGAPRPVQRGR